MRGSPTTSLPSAWGFQLPHAFAGCGGWRSPGVIKGYTALVDPTAEGWTMTAIASVRLSRQHEDEIQMFETAVRSWDEVLECHLVTGSRDYVLKVMSAGLDQYERFIKEKIARLKCVDTIETSFVMNTIKERRI